MSTTKNGAGVQGTPAQKEAAKIELSTVKVPAPAKPAASIDEIKKRVVDYQKLLERHSLLADSKNKLDSFAIGSDENNQSLRLRDESGNQFLTGNPIVIKEVIALIRKQLNTQCGAVETEILNFAI